MAGLFTSKQEQEKLIAIFDIGSGSVGGAIVKMPQNPNSIPTIISSTRTEIVFHSEIKFDVFLEDMANALMKTSEDLYNTKVGAPSEIVCILASPWYVSESRIIKIEKNSPFVFSKKFADELIHKEIEILNSTYEKKYESAKSAPELIESKIISVYLNGYKTNDPLNKHVKKVEMNMVISLSPEDCVAKIRQNIEKTFHGTPIRFGAFMSSAYIAVREKYVDASQYLLMDISGEVTDMAIVSNDIIKFSFSFPFGRQTLYRFLNEKLGKSIMETKSLFSLYVSNTLEKGQKDILEVALASIRESWIEAFRQSVKGLSNNAFTLPSTIFMIADDDILKWFSNIIENDPYFRSLMSDQKSEILTLEGPEFINMCGVKNTSCDPFLMIESIAVSRK